MIRLIGVDVDGTLLDSGGQIPDENRRAIHDALDAGVHVALVTGRSYPSVRPMAEPLPGGITLIVSNGAVERTMDGSTLARRLLDRRIARTILEGTRPRRDAAALIFDRDVEHQFVFESMNWEHPARRPYFDRNRSLITQMVPLESALVEDPIQVMFNGGVEAMRALAGELARHTDTCTISVTEYEQRDFSLIDITAPAASKGHALAWRAAQLGLSRDEVMAVGDNFNDIRMLEFAGLPVVMANAVNELKTRGWHVTGDQNDAGLAQAIRRFVLGGK